MAISAKFVADFSSFQDAVAKAEVSLKSFTTGASKVEAQLNRAADAFSGRKILSEATLAAAAIEKIGGVSKLTASEQATLNRTVTEALAKYKALGIEAPNALHALQAQTAQLVHSVEPLPPKLAQVSTEAKKAGGALSSMKGVAGSLAGAFGVAFSIGAVVNWVGGVVDAASHIDDLSKKLGASREAVQRWQFAAEQSGASIDDVATSISFMNKTLAVGDSSTIGALRLAGLRFEDIRKMKPEDAFNTIAEAIGKIEDPMTRARVAVDLFGRGGQTLLPAISEGFVKVGDQAAVMSEETVKRLDAAGDAWAKLSNTVKIYSGEMIAVAVDMFSQPPPINLQKWLDALHLNTEAATSDLQDLGGWLDALRDKIENVPKVAAPKLHGMEPLSVPQMSDADMQKILDDLVKEKDRLNDASAAAKRHAAELKALAEEVSKLAASFSGQGALAEADKLLTALGRIGSLSKIGHDNAENLAKTVTNLADRMTSADPAQKVMIDSLRQIGREASLAAFSLEKLSLVKIDYKKTLPTNLSGQTLQDQIPLIPRSSLISDSGLLDQIPGLNDKLILTKDQIKATDDAFKKMGGSTHESSQAVAELAASLTQLAQIGGSAFGPILQGAAAIVSALDAAEKAQKRLGGSVGIASALFSSQSTATEKWAAGIASAGAIAQGAMSVWSSTANDATKKAGAFHGAMSGAQAGAVFGPYGMAVGAAAGAIAGLIHTLSAGRREVKAFAESFNTAAAGTGFDELRKKLLVLGDEGERLWIKLTQGTKKGDKAGAARVEQEIRDALAAHDKPMEEVAAAGFKTQAELQKTADTAKRVYETMKNSGMFAASAVQEAWEQSQAAQRAAMGQTGEAYDKAVAAIKGMDDQIKSLSDSIAGEAPEEFMGIVERNAREQIAAIQKQRDEAQLALDQTAGDAAESAEAAAKAIEDTLDRHDFRVNIKVNVDYPPGYDPQHPELWLRPAPDFTTMPVPGAPTPEYPGFATGTQGRYLDFGPGTNVTLHGRERVMTEAEGRSTTAIIPQPIILQTFLDGRKVAESIVPHIPRVVERYGLV